MQVKKGVFVFTIAQEFLINVNPSNFSDLPEDSASRFKIAEVEKSSSENENGNGNDQRSRIDRQGQFRFIRGQCLNSFLNLIEPIFDQDFERRNRFMFCLISMTSFHANISRFNRIPFKSSRPYWETWTFSTFQRSIEGFFISLGSKNVAVFKSSFKFWIKSDSNTNRNQKKSFFWAKGLGLKRKINLLKNADKKLWS